MKGRLTLCLVKVVLQPTTVTAFPGTGGAVDSIVNSPSLHRIVLTTKEGEIKEMKTFTRLLQLGGFSDPSEYGDVDHDRMYGLINEGRDLVSIQYYIFDKLLRDVNYYQAGNPIQFEIEHYQVVQ